MRGYLDGQSTEFRRRTLGAIMSLGAGAGLSAHEMLTVRPEHLEPTCAALLVHVGGPRKRTVPLVAEWEDLLFDAVDLAEEGQYFFLPRTSRQAKNALWNFLRHCNGHGIRPNPQRLRSTWLVTQLNGGTPLSTLMWAAGLKEMSSLNRYLRFLEPIATDLELNLLRQDNSK